MLKKKGLIVVAILMVMTMLMSVTAFAEEKIYNIPEGYYAMYFNSNKDNRVDAWVYYNKNYEMQIDFGHYTPTGSGDFYSETDPNGDSLILYEDYGKIYGQSTKKNAKKYRVKFDGKKIKIEWVKTSWNSGGDIVLQPVQLYEGGGVG